ncbi:MAG: hypothetical protein Q8O72_14090 [Bacteroidales bacterium]|nr:hypothetical protein [Bacteroidales bacterium]
MKSEFRKFLKTIVLVVLFTGVASFIVQKVFPNILISRHWPWILLFLFSFTLYIYWLLIKQYNNKLSRFTNTLMLVNFGKLFLYTILIAVYSWLNRDQAISFALTFFVYYIIITFVEIKALLNLT